MNSSTIEKLQLNEVKEQVKTHCVSYLGRNLIDNLSPSGDIKVVSRRLNENQEARRVVENSTHIPLEGLFNIIPVIDKVEKGMILEASELIDVQDFLRGCRKIKKFMEEKEFYSPKLSSYSSNITEFKNIEDEINYCIKGNKVDSNASNELKKIRRNIDTAEGKIKDRLNKFITSSVNKKYIQEFIITKRNDRYVVPIKSSYKNEVKGTVLDTSSKGNTVFIEPESISKVSTDLIMLLAEESVEEYKILSHLTELIYEDIRKINLNIEVISEYDMVFAKAKYSQNIKAVTPNINNRGYIKIINGKHPLLADGAVPLNFEVGKQYRSLIITGPNAGGKTVTLKTVGLLTAMAECGFDLPVEEGTEISVFENIFVDIGDNQSIANSLSTFSSHIKNIAHIVRKSNNSTLVLLDEIGSGTDPNEGAGLAISILEELYMKGCITVASTHYGEIKKFATQHPDFENAGMLFDLNTLEPMYKLTIGKSEDSNALYISRKMGISEKIIQRAKGYIENREYNSELIENNKILKESHSLKDDNSMSSTYVDYERGDRVWLLDKGDYGIVYKSVDHFNNVDVFYDKNIIPVNIKRLELKSKAEDLYPLGYDIDSLFTEFKVRKLDKDIKRGSKKALKQIRKQIKRDEDILR
ncbi:endonuclease MutS2 [Clostridioides mangenotii]|uniref:endonuclease MutS2 n=1 Tax=Metaclostridioides mangenotii TaxID=1540 RepID=UPI001C11988B|nr:endonuclease MutS2 [Clostridioides mangenotii]MBU5308206.1 endonuclease MutS2 [Clostridioides mangenotii]MCR1955516.1 endonuclease MutS2 [Clostridioides mangenotii]